MKKINIAELLKDCPKGMELDCVMFVNPVTLKEVSIECSYPIAIKTIKGDIMVLTEYGQYADAEDAKCIIFPKGKNTWDGFVPPCNFKDGDILSYQFKGANNRSIYIYKQHNSLNTSFYVALDCESKLIVEYRYGYGYALNGCDDSVRLATEEEKAKLFNAIKENGYRWNEETKTLEEID